MYFINIEQKDSSNHGSGTNPEKLFYKMNDKISNSFKITTISRHNLKQTLNLTSIAIN